MVLSGIDCFFFRPYIFLRSSGSIQEKYYFCYLVSIDMKILAIGRNYADHIEELKNERPDDPVVFLKPDTAIIKNNAPFYYPDFSSDIHHEVEVLIKISKEGKFIEEKFAHRYYDEIGIGIDDTLIPLVIYCLEEISLAVKQPDTDQWQAHIACCLTVVPRQNAEAAGVNRHRFVDAELGAEVADGAG